MNEFIIDTSTGMAKPVRKPGKEIIDLGSGPWPKADATIRVDVNKWPGVDVMHDLSQTPYPFDSEIAEKIYFGDVIEHLSKFVVDDVLKEINRILVPGGTLEVTTPDIDWVAERLYKKDWKDMANVDWLNKNCDPFEDAMEVIFGGWLHPTEHAVPGMGHVNGFNEEKLKRYLKNNGFSEVYRVPDERNPLPARGCVLKVIAVK
jgi:predicted SAM-dependent methyltransferase